MSRADAAQELLALACRLAVDAGTLAEEGRRLDVETGDTRAAMTAGTKSSRTDVVTRHDRAAEALIVEDCAWHVPTTPSSARRGRTTPARLACRGSSTRSTAPRTSCTACRCGRRRSARPTPTVRSSVRCTSRRRRTCSRPHGVPVRRATGCRSQPAARSSCRSRSSPPASGTRRSAGAPRPPGWPRSRRSCATCVAPARRRSTSATRRPVSSTRTSRRTSTRGTWPPGS